ncbi:MAG: superoxide dismutase [Ni] [bacterium]|nr:superoxide dismutase [Ni] [bacterium]
MKTVYGLMLFLGFLLVGNPSLFAHCEVPCGIYGDENRLQVMAEHVATIEKAINQIGALSKEGDKNYNQIVRWVNTKENHANELQHIVTQYFMTQRVKPVDPKDGEKHKAYQEQVTALHQMLVYAMKTKQSLDLENVEKLKGLLNGFHNAYMGAHQHK